MLNRHVTCRYEFASEPLQWACGTDCSSTWPEDSSGSICINTEESVGDLFQVFYTVQVLIFILKNCILNIGCREYIMGMLASQTTVLKQITSSSATFQDLLMLASNTSLWFPKTVVRWNYLHFYQHTQENLICIGYNYNTSD